MQWMLLSGLWSTANACLSAIQPASQPDYNCLSVCLSILTKENNCDTVQLPSLSFLIFIGSEKCQVLLKSLNSNIYVQTHTHTHTVIWTYKSNMHNFVNLHYIRHLHPSMFNPFHATDKMICSTTYIILEKFISGQFVHEITLKGLKVNLKNFSTLKALPYLVLSVRDTMLARQLWKDTVYSKSSNDVTAHYTHQMRWVWKVAYHFKMLRKKEM